MCGSGAVISGMALIAVPRQMVPHGSQALPLPGFPAAVAGTAPPGAVVLLVATGSSHRTRATIWAFAFL